MTTPRPVPTAADPAFGDATLASGALRWRPEYLFPAVLVLFGVFYVFALPPIVAPDEHDHFFRAYAISTGRLFFDVQGGQPGCTVPVCMNRLEDRFLRDPSISWRKLQEAASEPFDSRKQAWAKLPLIASTFFVPYIPQALAIATVRSAGANALQMVYAGRLANLLFAAFLLHISLRLAPVFKMTLGVVALLPISVQQLASLSPDGSIISVALLFTALVLRFACGRGPRFGFASLLLVAGSMAWLTLCKFPYITLSLFYFAIPRARAGGWAAYLGKTSFFFGVAAAAFACWAGFTSSAVPKRQPKPAGDSPALLQEQVDFIKRNPVRVAQTFVESAIDEGSQWLGEMTYVGPLEMNPLFTQGLIVLMFASAMLDPQKGINLRVKGAALLAAAACLTALLYSLYVWWTPLGCGRVEGIQGRYLLPLLPLVLAPLASGRTQWKGEPHWPLLYAVFGSAAVLTGAAVTLLQECWVARVLLPPHVAPVAAAVVAFALTVLGARSYFHYRRRSALPT